MPGDECCAVGLHSAAQCDIESTPFMLWLFAGLQRLCNNGGRIAEVAMPMAYSDVGM